MVYQRAMRDMVLIVDFGSQVTQLIARRVRESGVYCEVVPAAGAADALAGAPPRAVVLSGGPESVTRADAPLAPPALFDLDAPVLGICYGQQAMAAQLGGRVAAGGRREFGRAEATVTRSSPLFEGIAKPGDTLTVWMSHGDSVERLPEGFQSFAESPGAPNAAIQDTARRRFGVQFHPEVVHTPAGAAMLRNFTHRVAGCAGDWTMAAFREAEVQRIRARVGAGRVLCALSGGVDSSVTAALVHEAVGDRLECVFVDTGLLREGEADQVERLFGDRLKMRFHRVDAGGLFLARLAGVRDPEVKRKRIGGAFIDVFEERARAFGGADFLAQGTLYPDVIESAPPAGGASATIKSHHNVGGLPERMSLTLLEPLRMLFKDEVRALGRELGLPEAAVGRHPFPGPGLAIRIPGEVTADKLAMLRRADSIFIDEIRAAGLYDAVWQAFAVLLPVRTVGVMGDERTYERACALRAVAATDGMTAESFPFEHAFLARAAGRIVNEVPGINRVVYDVTSKPPGTIEWE